MKVKLNDGTTIEVAHQQGRAFIAAGLATKVEPPKIEVRHNTSWHVHPGDRIEDYQGPPRINFNCPCGVKGTTRGSVPHWDGKGESLRPGANREMVPFVLKHVDGSVENIPDDILGHFLKLYKNWQARSRRPVPGRINTNKQTDPARDIALYGIKPREVLMAEARAKKG